MQKISWKKMELQVFREKNTDEDDREEVTDDTNTSPLTEAQVRIGKEIPIQESLDASQCKTINDEKFKKVQPKTSIVSKVNQEDFKYSHGQHHITEHSTLDRDETNQIRFSARKKQLMELFERLQEVLESDEYDESLRRSLQESYPDYIEIIDKRKRDLLKEDHGIVVAGETSSGKSTLINKILEKRLFKSRIRRSTSTICKIRNSEKVQIFAESMNGEIRKIPVSDDCNIETKAGKQLLRDTLRNLTDLTSGSDSSLNLRSIDIGFPLPFLKGNTIIVDTPGIDGSEAINEKLMEYIPNAVSFIFVVDIGCADAMKKLPEILRKILQLHIRDEMPCFDPEKVMFITNKWDIVQNIEVNDDSSDEEHETWQDVNEEIRASWPSVTEENIFKMSLKHVSSNATNASTNEFQRFQHCLNKNIKESENVRLSKHLSFLDEFLENVSRGINSGLVLETRNEEELRALENQHEQKIKQLTVKCTEEERTLRENFQSIVENAAQEVFEYMSSDHGKDSILNPPGQERILDMMYLPYVLSEQIKLRVQMYVQSYFKSGIILEKLKTLKEETIAFYNEVSSEISEMEDDWTNYSQKKSEGGLKAPNVAAVIFTSPVLIPLAAAVIGFTFANLGLSLLATPIIVPVIAVLGRDCRKQRIIDEGYDECRLCIRNTISNHLQIIYGDTFKILIKKITSEILPRRIASLETMVRSLLENRQQILTTQEKYRNLSEKMQSIKKTKLEIHKCFEEMKKNN